MAGEKRSWKIAGAEVEVTLPERTAAELRKTWEQVRESAGVGPRTAKSAQARARAQAREQLSTERIVDTAIEQMREVGYEAVTMRSIARALGTGPASLYAHVANRGELDALVVDRVAAQVPVPDPDPAHWDEQVRQLCSDMIGVYRAHPGSARASMGMIPVQPGTLVTTERILALLKAGEVPDQYAAWFADVIALYVGAAAAEEEIRSQRGREQGADATEDAVVAQVRDYFSQLPAEHFPTISSMATALTAGSADDRFGFGVDLLVTGLKTMSDLSGRPKTS